MDAVFYQFFRNAVHNEFSFPLVKACSFTKRVLTKLSIEVVVDGSIDTRTFYTPVKIVQIVGI